MSLFFATRLKATPVDNIVLILFHFYGVLEGLTSCCFIEKKTETRKRRSSPARLNKKRQPLIETCDWIFFLEIHFQRSRKVDFFLPQNREKIKIKQPVQVIRPFFLTSH